MEFVFIIIALFILAILFNIKLRKIKNTISDDSLNSITRKLPSNTVICKDILKIVGRDIVIEEDEKANSSMYIVLTDKIILGKMKEDWIRIQTISHECVHSTQNRKILLGNFIISNLYKVYFIVSIILTIFGIYGVLNLYILTIFSFLCISVRNYLETNAMTKAEFIAEKYLNTTDLTKEEIVSLMNKYCELNRLGIPLANYLDIVKDMAKPLIYGVVIFTIGCF